MVGLSHIGWVFYTSSSVHTGGPSSKACTRVDVVQKRFLQLCCFHSVHRVSAHERHVCMASLYLFSSVHTGGPSSEALTRIDVVQKQFLQLCCFYSFHRVSAHDAACLYGIVVYVEQRPHWRCHVCCMLCLTPGNTRYDATQCRGRPPFLTLFVYVPWLNRLVSKTVSGGPQRVNRKITVSHHPMLGQV